VKQQYKQQKKPGINKVKAITYPPADFSASQWRYEHMMFGRRIAREKSGSFFASLEVFTASSFLHVELRVDFPSLAE